MIDPDKPQAWFVKVAFEDIYHTHLLLIQGTLGECLKKVRYLSQRTGCLATVHPLVKQTIRPQADHIYKAMAEEGMLLAEVAKVNYDYASWTASLARQLESLPEEQRLAEAFNLKTRLDKEIAALMLLVEKGDEVPAIDGSTQPTPKEANNERERTSEGTTEQTPTVTPR